MRSPPRYGPPPMDRRTDYPVSCKTVSPFHLWRESNLKLQNIHICVCRTTYAVSPTSHPLHTTATPTTIPTLPHTPGGEKDLTAQTEIFTELFSRYYEGPPPTYRGREESRSRWALVVLASIWHQFYFFGAAGRITTERWRSSCAGLQTGRVKGESRMPCHTLRISYKCVSLISRGISEKDLLKVQKHKIHRTLAGMGGGSFEFDPKCDSPFFRLQTFDKR